MMQIDTLIHSARQIATCASPNGPKRGADLQDSGLIENGAVAINDGLIVDIGETAILKDRYQAREIIDAAGRAICPGFVDPHTHTVYGGDRAGEFELRIKGASYVEIMAAGGGIVSTMRHTREASLKELVASAKRRLDEMLSLGSTTVEIKSGYGLDTATELKMLEAIAKLDQTHPCDIVPTFLGAHTLPPEYKDDPQGYVQLVIEEMLPAVADWYHNSHFPAQGTPFFVDVFCEEHAFDLEQSYPILQTGIALGLGAKIHADQFNALGGVSMAVELGAVSADHLDVTTATEIKVLARSPTIAVPLPAANFNLAQSNYANARAMVDAGATLALATDINPGSAPCPSMPMVMAIACRYQKLLPAEALNASTINAAYAIGIGNKLGSLEVGKQADLLILKEGDLRHIPYFFGHNPVAAVIKRGRVLL